MNLSEIRLLSARDWNDYFPLQVVYEWEDIIAKELDLTLDHSSTVNINLVSEKLLNRQLQKVIRRTFLSNYIDSSFNYLKREFPEHYFLCFFLYPLPIKNHYIYNDNIIPILIDCFSDVIDKVPTYFKKSKFIFVTNLEVYEYLKQSSLSTKMVYLPLSISDSYYKKELPNKDLDVLQMGRQNPVLHNWMLEIIRKYPHIEYIYSHKNGNVHGYFSTTKGWLGPIDNRQDFMQLLSRAKISLLSSPGIDGGEIRTGGFNPVTPRFYESAINYCYMVGRYPKEALDFVNCKISQVCQHFENYSAFEEAILQMIATPFNLRSEYDQFIQQHLTSRRATVIRKTLEQL